ncbi:MAG: spore germination protein [Bacilli bacterium]
MIDELYKTKEHMPDLQIKEMSFGLNKLYIVNIQTVSSSTLTNQYILDYLAKRSLIKSEFSSLKKDIMNYIPSVSFIEIKKKDLFFYLFSGFSAVIYKNEIIVFETKAELDRAVSEPSSEPTIRGPKDSFNENYNTNLGLIRKRLKDENLYFNELILGEKTKTKICVMYMNNLVDSELLNYTLTSIKNIKTDKILDTYYIKELIKKENKSLFPTAKMTEKPDIIAKALSEGKICVVTENSNSVLIIPTFFIDFFYNDEDNYHKKVYVYFVKILRIIVLFITIFTPALYLSLITYDQQMLPIDLLIKFSIQRNGVPFPVIIEALLLMLTFEILYEADALTPTSRGTSLSILGALVLGDAAVGAGIISPIMVIIVAITAISSIFFIYQNFQSFIRAYRYSLMILASFFGIVGILFGFMFLLTDLCSIKSFGKPFLLPIAPILGESKKQLIKKGLLTQNTNKGDL